MVLQAYVLEKEGRLLELVDPNLSSNYSKEEALQMLNLSLICTNQSPTLRPPMSMVVSMLDGKTPVQAPPRNPATTKNEEIMVKSFGNLSNHSQTRSISTDGPWTESSASVQSRQEEILPSSSSKLLLDYSELSTTESQR